MCALMDKATSLLPCSEAPALQLLTIATPPPLLDYDAKRVSGYEAWNDPPFLTMNASPHVLSLVMTVVEADHVAADNDEAPADPVLVNDDQTKRAPELGLGANSLGNEHGGQVCTPPTAPLSHRLLLSVTVGVFASPPVLDAGAPPPAVDVAIPDSCTLASFLAMVGRLVPPAVLCMPPRAPKAPVTEKVRRSACIAKKKASEGGSSYVMAMQEVLARACGNIEPAAKFDKQARETYLEMFKMPLDAPVIQAMETLVKQIKKFGTKAKKKKAGKITGLEGIIVPDV